MNHCRRYALLLLLYLTSAMSAPNWQAANSVVKILAKADARQQHLGSGVLIDHDLVVTNCHVTRKATQIQVIKNDQLYRVISQARLPELDVCVVRTQTRLPFDTAPLGQAQVGQTVQLFGYPFALGVRMHEGRLIAAHPYQNNHILEVDQGFMQGASGGGVFDQQGRLIGLMTFIGRDERGLHFYAIPSAWIKNALTQPQQPLTPFSALSFWEKQAFKP
ncbi:MAG: serine protease [Methylococcales bacterium]|nr:serine protease [Methylococcales bacterium]